MANPKEGVLVNEHATCTHCGKDKEVDHETIDARYPMVRCLNADKEIVLRPGIRGDGMAIVRERRAKNARRAHARHSLKPSDERPKTCALCRAARREAAAGAPVS